MVSGAENKIGIGWRWIGIAGTCIFKKSPRICGLKSIRLNTFGAGINNYFTLADADLLLFLFLFLLLSFLPFSYHRRQHNIIIIITPDPLHCILQTDTSTLPLNNPLGVQAKTARTHRGYVTLNASHKTQRPILTDLPTIIPATWAASTVWLL